MTTFFSSTHSCQHPLFWPKIFSLLHLTHFAFHCDLFKAQHPASFFLLTFCPSGEAEFICKVQNDISIKNTSLSLVKLRFLLLLWWCIFLDVRGCLLLVGFFTPDLMSHSTRGRWRHKWGWKVRWLKNGFFKELKLEKLIGYNSTLKSTGNKLSSQTQNMALLAIFFPWQCSTNIWRHVIHF